MRRFSIRTLMAFVLVSAVGMAALRNASDLWAGMMLMAALAAVGVAVLGAALMRDRERAWWLGFGLFGGAYLIVSLIPPLESRLPTSKGLGYFRSKVSNWGSEVEVISIEPMGEHAIRGGQVTIWDENLVFFRQIGHSLLTLLAGLLGGIVAVWFYARRERAEL